MQENMSTKNVVVCSPARGEKKLGFIYHGNIYYAKYCTVHCRKNEDIIKK